MTRRRSAADEQALMEVLTTSPIFRRGQPADLAALARQATPFDYPTGSFLMRQGEPATHVLVLTAGEVAIVSPIRGGGEQVHAIVGAGQLIGELALLNDGRRTAGARATSPTTAWAIGREPFWAFLEVHPPASSALLRQVAARLAAREALIDDLLSLDVKGRLAKVLLGLAAPGSRCASPTATWPAWSGLAGRTSAAPSARSAGAASSTTTPTPSGCATGRRSSGSSEAGVSQITATG
jgi:CRP/FNR family cyclic AMP-dependent transcriptional regulator